MRKLSGHPLKSFRLHVLILKIFFNSLVLVQLSFENDLYPF